MVVATLALAALLAWLLVGCGAPVQCSPPLAFHEGELVHHRLFGEVLVEKVDRYDCGSPYLILMNSGHAFWVPAWSLSAESAEGKDRKKISTF